MSEPRLKEQLAARWLAWRLAWGRLPATQRNLYTAAAAGTLVALYAVLIWPLAGQQIDKLRYALEKQAVRDRKTAQGSAQQAVTVPASLGGKGAEDAKVELRDLKRRLEETTLELADLRRRFVSLDDSLAMNALKSGLTSLAEAGDMEVAAIEHVHLRAEDKDRPPTPALIQEAARNNAFKRPLLELRARASFHGLMQFLDGLGQMPYVAAPVGCDIKVQVERHPQTGAPVRQWLELRIKLAV